MRKITLAKAWGKYAAGDVLAVWEPGVALGRGVVDPGRAATLLEAELAIEGEAPAPAPTKGKRAARAAE